MSHSSDCQCESCCYEQGFEDGASQKEVYCNLYPEYFQVVAYNEGRADAIRLKHDRS